MISVFCVDRLSRANLGSLNLSHQIEMGDLRCRIDRRCTHQTENRDLARGYPFANETARVWPAEICCALEIMVAGNG